MDLKNFKTKTQVSITSLQAVIIAFTVSVLIAIGIVFYLHVQELEKITLQKEQFETSQDVFTTPESDGSDLVVSSATIPILPLPLEGFWKTNSSYEVGWSRPIVSVDTYSVILLNTVTGKEKLITESTTGTNEIITISSELFSEMLDYKKYGNDSFYIVVRGREKGFVVAEAITSPITVTGTILSETGSIIESNTDVTVRAQITDTNTTQLQKAVSGTSDIYKVTYNFDVYAEGVGDDIFIDKNIFIDNNASAVQKGFGYYLASVPPADAVDISSSISTNAQLGKSGYKIKVGEREKFTISFIIEALAPVVDMQIRLNTIGWSGIDSSARYLEYFDDNAVQSVSLVSRKTVTKEKPVYERIGLRPTKLVSDTRAKLYIYEITAPESSSVYLKSQSLFIGSENLTMDNLYIEIDPRTSRGVSANKKEFVGTLNSGTFVADGSIITVPLSREVVVSAGTTMRFTLYGDLGSVGQNAFVTIRHPSLSESFIRS